MPKNASPKKALSERLWSTVNPLSLLLWPLSLLFRVVVWLRRWAYQIGWLKSFRVTAPVIVVGNIVVGGTGKTPLLIRLVELLRQSGYQPGIVSRGYGGSSKYWPRDVEADSDPDEVGDEPVLLAKRCGCPVVVAPDRVSAAQKLLRDYDCNVILSDDGLQHYRLKRDIEIAVINATQRFGNGFCLPAGPLREPVKRLTNVDFVINNHPPPSSSSSSRRAQIKAGEYSMSLQVTTIVNMGDPAITRSIASFAGHTVHAVAAIGHPTRFFYMLGGNKRRSTSPRMLFQIIIGLLLPISYLVMTKLF